MTVNSRGTVRQLGTIRKSFKRASRPTPSMLILWKKSNFCFAQSKELIHLMNLDFERKDTFLSVRCFHDCNKKKISVPSK